MKLRILQFSFLDEIHSHPWGPAGKKERLTSVRMTLLKGCNATLADTEKKHPTRSLHADFPEKEQTAQLRSLLTEDRLREMMKGRIYYAVETVFLYVATFIDRSFGSLERGDLTWMILFYAKMFDELHCNHSGAAWTAEELGGRGRRFQSSGLLVRRLLRRSAHLVYAH